jgi:type IX secretion system PorP/SprF family membrane protein
VKNLLSIRPILFIAFLVGSFLPGKAQDIHFSQFGNAPLNLNPALNGVFGGDMRFGVSWRDQWRSVPVPFTTLAATFENKFYHERGKYNRYFTGGLVLNYDKQGSLELTTLNIGIPISYTAPLAKEHYLTLGIMPAFGQRSFGTDKLTTDAQWNGLFFDPFGDTREGELFVNNNLKYFDLSAGLNYRYQSIERRDWVDVGVALHHINRPDHDFWTQGDDVRLSSRFSLYALGNLQITPKRLDLVLQGLYQRQGGYEKIIYGIGGQIYLTPERRYREMSVQGGIRYRARYNDAVIPYLELHYNTWILGGSWDFNISDFKPATSFRGGPELTFRYRLYRVKPLPFKSCPII